ATGSSKSHTVESLESCGAEVQKGNAPEERKLQRLFRNPEASKLITRCNDFGAGGVSVAIGELADGLDIDLGAVPKKYEGLDGTELAISESQERMAVVVAAKDVARFCELAATENLEATVVAKVKADPRLTMTLDGRVICDISREFLNSNGAEKHIDIEVGKSESCARTAPKGSFTDNMKALVGDLKVCSRRGLSERFDSTIGAGTVMMPFGGKNQLTPIQAMVHKIPVENGDTNTVSFMSWGFDPYLSESNPFCGAYNAVIESVAKLAAAGANLNDTYLTFQEYFEKPGRDPKRWGKPFSALLGAYKAQMELGMGSIGGKDSMSGSFEDLDVPPTLVSFAVTTGTISQALSNEFKTYGHKVVMIAPKYDENGLVDCDSFRTAADTLFRIISEGKVCAAYTPTSGGVAEAVFKMTIGNGIGFKFADKDVAFATPAAGCFVVELTDIVNIDNLIKEFADNGINVSLVGQTCKCKNITCGDETVAIDELLTIYEGKLEPVFSCNIEMPKVEIPKFTYTASSYPIPKEKFGAPKMIIPVFPGTNCEYDTAKAAERAGIETEIIVIRNLSAADIAESAEYFTKAVKNAQMIFVPGGFSGGDEPDGSGKFITAFFRNKNVTEAVTELLEQRDGLMCGVCNGFQALIKLGLVPYGKIIDTDENCPTLTYNTIGRHQSRLVRTRVASNKSPWFSSVAPGSILTVPISHGEGRFIASDELVAKLAENGQIATQYVDELGNPTNDIRFNPNNSTFAIEGITSPDGRVLGKMGHSERVGQGLYKNVEGRYESWLFASAKGYYSL
ncbi:MAG: phosphoribosylformylglycinamidine synthase, partial [Clostridia bacterium]|nr:phosphoribosylformylglycinamidine synthase [Clostridia bacterium]